METKFQILRGRYGALYSEADKRVKWNARTDKRVFIENVAAETERAAAHQEQGTVFRITKQTCGGSYSSNASIRDKQGNVLTSDKEQERRWAELGNSPCGTNAHISRTSRRLVRCLF